MTFQQLTGKLWEDDPGYFRLKQSFKTLFAVFLLMALTYAAPLQVKLLSAIAAGFSMQAIIGDSRRTQLQFMLLAFPLFFICYLIGYFSKGSDLLSSSALTVLGFLAVYMRRFGPDFNFMPIIAWAFCFLGMLLPIPLQQYWSVMGALLLGLVVSALVYLYVFPQRKTKLYFENFSVFMKDYANSLQWLAHILTHETTLEKFEADKVSLKNHLFQLTTINGEIAQNKARTESSCAFRLNYLYVRQYALAKVLTMILEGIGELIKAKVTLSDSVRSHLFTVFAIYASALNNLDIGHECSNHKAVLRTLEITKANLDAFQNLLIKCIMMEKPSIIPLININLGLRLILRNIQSMEQNNEE